MSNGLWEGVLEIDRPITDLTGTVCQPGRYEVFDLEGPDHSAGITGSWVGLAPVWMSTEQLQFFGDVFPERFTFDPDEVLPAFEAGRERLAEEQAYEDEQARAWAEENPEIVIADRLTPQERDELTAKVLVGNPHLQGARAADILDIFDTGDIMLATTERFYEEHTDWHERDVSDHRQRHFAVIAAAILQPEDMLPLVERLLYPEED